MFEHCSREKRETIFIWCDQIARKVVQYHLISKNLHEIYDGGSNQLGDIHDDNDDDDCDNDELLQQFQTEHNVYEFIPSFESVRLSVFVILFGEIDYLD
ncbi:hypothetical protein Tco_0638349 [Tanacetum coccineum]